MRDRGSPYEVNAAVIRRFVGAWPRCKPTMSRMGEDLMRFIRGAHAATRAPDANDERGNADRASTPGPDKSPSAVPRLAGWYLRRTCLAEVESGADPLNGHLLPDWSAWRAKALTGRRSCPIQRLDELDAIRQTGSELAAIFMEPRPQTPTLLSRRRGERHRIGASQSFTRSARLRLCLGGAQRNSVPPDIAGVRQAQHAIRWGDHRHAPTRASRADILIRAHLDRRRRPAAASPHSKRMPDGAQHLARIGRGGGRLARIGTQTPVPVKTPGRSERASSLRSSRSAALTTL